MFDLMMPIMCDPDSGEYTTIMWAGDDAEEYLITLVEGFGISDLMEYWLREGFALVIDKTRKRGILPMQISYDDDGRFGCWCGCGLVLDSGNVHIRDMVLFKKTCACHPLEWWKCVDVRSVKAYTRWIVPEKDFLAWVERLESLMHVRDCMIDNWSYDRKIMCKNLKILSNVLNGLAGGSGVLSILPPDWMKRSRGICRGGPYGRGNIIDLSECAGVVVEFDEGLADPRDNGEVAWWINRAFTRDNIVVFLCPNGKAKTGVPVYVVRPSDNIDEILPEILEKTCTGSEAVDHVAFSARCDLEELRGDGNNAVLTRGNFRKLLKGASRVLLGTCKGTSWEEFPLGKRVCQPCPPLFKTPGGLPVFPEAAEHLQTPARF